MESETIIEVPLQKPKHKFFVYYDLNGKIKQITKDLLEDSDYEYVVTDMPEAGDIISGHINQNHWCVSFSDATQQIEFMHKKYAGTLRPAEDLLYQIPIIEDAIIEPDILVELYPVQNVLAITIGESCKKRLLWGLNIYDLKNTTGSALNLYITKKDNPDHLIVQVDVDPMELIMHQKLIVEIPTTLTRYVNFNDISIFTTRLFEEYACKLLNDLVDHDPLDNRRLKIAEDTNEGHITFSKTKDNKLSVKAIQDIGKITPEKALQFFILDAIIDYDIESRFIESIWANTEEIVEGKIFDIEVPDKFSVLHKYKLTVGVDYETQH